MLAIIALIIGGLAVARSMIANAGVRSLVADVEHNEQAIDNFQEKYSALPGDLANATSYWGADTSTACTGAAVTADRVPKKATCNGDGNGQLGNTDIELFTAWVQLADAGLLGGSFTGVSEAGGTNIAKIGTNVPPAKIEGLGFAFQAYLGDGYAGDSAHYAGDYGNATLVLNSPNGPALSPSDAMSLDGKLDDGMPAGGRIKSFTAAATRTAWPARPTTPPMPAAPPAPCSSISRGRLSPSLEGRGQGGSEARLKARDPHLSSPFQGEERKVHPGISISDFPIVKN